MLVHKICQIASSFCSHIFFDGAFHQEDLAAYLGMFCCISTGAFVGGFGDGV